MTKTLSLVSLAVMAVTLQAQTAASPGTTPNTTSSNSPATAPQTKQVQAASLTAELTKSIDSKRAKVGDEIDAKTMTEAKLPDGTNLPKGTKVVGNVVDVKAKSKEDKNSHLVLALNRVVLKDGHEVPIRAAVTSVTAPINNVSNDMAAMPSAGGGSMGPPSGGSSPGGGGTSTSAPAPPASAPAMSTDTGPQAQSTQGQVLKSAQDRVAVGNKPNITLSAPTTPESAGVLDGTGDNISLASGTKLTLNVVPAQPGT